MLFKCTCVLLSVLFLTSLNFHSQVIDEAMQSQERYKQQRITTKSQVDDMEDVLNEIRKRLTAQQKEIATWQKSINTLETKLEQKKADRHSLLKACKVIFFFFFFFFWTC